METEAPSRGPVLLPCAECNSLFAPSLTRTTICPTCISKKNDITSGIPKELLIQWCRYCFRFYGPPWILCQRESKELLAICLKKIKGINKMKIIEAGFMYTEEHSKRIRVKLTVQKEVMNDIKLQQSFEVEFTEVYTQCDDCKKDFTPHTWMACVQLRQRTDNRKTFFFLEQLLLKHGIHKKASKISAEKWGIDFFFTKRGAAVKLMEFVQAVLPTQTKESKELVSHNVHSAEFNYKFTTFIEIPKICKDDLVILPKKLCKEFGGMNNLSVCYKIGNMIHLYDPITLKKVEMTPAQYFCYQNDFKIIQFRSNETEFFISDITLDQSPKMSADSTFSNINRRFARAEVTRASDYQQFSCTTHLGHILSHGDTVLGYDLTTINCEELNELDNQKFIPDVILIRKIYPERKKRIWKLNRMQIETEDVEKATKPEEEAKQFEEFMIELEQDKHMRSRVNLLEDKKVIEELQADPEKEAFKHKEMVQLEELMKEVTLQEKNAASAEEMTDIIGELGEFAFKKNKP